MKNLLLLLSVLSVGNIQAQSISSLDRCGTDDRERIFMQTEPERYALYEDAYRNALEELSLVAATRTTDPTESCPDGVRIIPIYFHIIHNGGSASFPGDNNFTTSEIQAALDQLNMHYQGTNPQLSRVQDQFWADGRVSSNTCIQFCWNPTDIHRLDASQAPHSTNLFRDTNNVIQPTIQDHADAMLNASPYQNRCQYLNIYVGRYGVGLNGGGLLGYAWNMFSTSAGVRIDDNVFLPGGAITNPADSRGVTFAHEVGHFLGLPHIWGQANIGNWNALTASTYCGIDDGMADTPNQARPASGPGAGVPTYTQNEVVTHCGNTIMWTNMMDYSSNAWTVNFTDDQADFMRLFLTQAENLLPSGANCDTSGGFLNGENRCAGQAIACDVAPVNPLVDTLFICGTDTLNLNQHIQNWGLDIGKSPATELSWRSGSLTGPLVDFPAKTIVTGNSTVCTPDTLTYYLNMKCTTTGTESLGGRVLVLSYLTPAQLLERYLQDGDCENGPGPVFSAADSAANCHELMAFVKQTNPTFPTTVSGEIVYDITFDDAVVGPCCTAPCTRTDTAAYRCDFSGGDCDGVAWSGGYMTVLSPCPDLDFDDTFSAYETSLVSLFDPNGYINDFYYFSDGARTTAFDESTDYVYDGDGCNFGSDIVIHTSMGCDTDNNNIPNGYIALGTVTLSAPMPFPSAPTLEYTLNGDMDCVYEAVPHCWDDDITPTIPVEVCGASDLEDITFSVLSGGGCVMEHTVAKPDCPDCGPSGGCVSTTWPGGSETICSGGGLADGFPVLDLIGGGDPLNDVIWANGPIHEPWVELYVTEPYDLPGYVGPTLNSDPTTGVDELHIYFAYSVCDDDADPETPAIYVPLGEYEVTVEPIPDGRVTPVCLGMDSLNFYVEVELLSNPQSNTFTATNSYDASALAFTDPGTQFLGPFPNGTDVSVDFAIDGGCAYTSETFNLGCLTSSCSPPELNYLDTCILNPGTNDVEYWIEASITGNTTSYLVRLTNDANQDTVLISMQQPVVGLGPFVVPQTINYTATDYANPACSATTEVIFNPCLLVGIADMETLPLPNLYPNPASETITFEFDNAEKVGMLTFSVYDVLGQLVWQGDRDAHSGMAHLSIERIPPGIYLAKVSDHATDQVYMLRFAKE